MTQSGPDASAQSVGRVAPLGRNVRQPNCVLGNWIADHKAERRPGAGEEGLAAAQHDGVEVKAILINKTKVSQASRQVWSADCYLPNALSLQLTDHRLEVILDKRGVRANRLQRARHDPLLLAPPRRRELAFLRAPLRTVFVPIAHNLVQAATVHAARQAAHLVYEVAKERWARRAKFLVVDVAVQGLVHSEDELSHATKSPPRFAGLGFLLLSANAAEWSNHDRPRAPRIDFANLPAPAEGILVTLFITVRKVARSRDFYSRVLGGTGVLDENPCMVKLSNSWIIMNPGGPPTPDKPGISVVDYQPGNTTSIFLNLRVADIQTCYEEWKAKGAEFVTPPIDRGAEIRCYMRDPDGYLIEVGQSTGLLHGKLAAKRPEDLPG